MWGNYYFHMYCFLYEQWSSFLKWYKIYVINKYKTFGTKLPFDSHAFKSNNLVFVTLNWLWFSLYS